MTDVYESVRHDAQGIIVSNHRWRQSDTTLNTINPLTDVMKVVDDSHQIEVSVVGCIRPGKYILEAIALGEREVLIGWLVLWVWQWMENTFADMFWKYSKKRVWVWILCISHTHP